MPLGEKNLPDAVRPGEDITLLVLSPDNEDAADLRRIFHHRDWRVVACREFSTSDRLLKSASIVLCERDLPDGNWKNVLNSLSSIDNPPLLIVMSRHADELLWAEVLNLGGYDVLQKPFETVEVMRVVSMARRQWLSQSLEESPTTNATAAHPVF